MSILDVIMAVFIVSYTVVGITATIEYLRAAVKRIRSTKKVTLRVDTKYEIHRFPDGEVRLTIIGKEEDQ